VRLFEIRDRRLFRFAGSDRKKFLNGLLTNDVLALNPGQGQSSCLLTPKGKMLADLELYDRGDDLLAIVPERAAKNFAAALSKRIVLSETTMADITAEHRLLLALDAEGDLPYGRLGVPGSFKLSGSGELTPASELEVLRVERGLPAFGVDIDEETLPLEARLEDAISFTKGCYIGQETTARIKNLGHVNRILVGLKGKALFAGAAVRKAGAEIGRLTSAVESPRFGGAVGMAMIRAEHAEAGTAVQTGDLPAEVVDLPRWA
jgi:tRNA-modifying protein YgfZ